MEESVESMIKNLANNSVFIGRCFQESGPCTCPSRCMHAPCSSSFHAAGHPRGLHAAPLTVEEVPGGSRLVMAKPQHRNVVKGRAQQLSQGKSKGVSDFCCLVLAIWKTTFLFGNYKSQSALWEEHASYQLVPSTNSQIWIRNQF